MENVRDILNEYGVFWKPSARFAKEMEMEEVAVEIFEELRAMVSSFPKEKIFQSILVYNGRIGVSNKEEAIIKLGLQKEFEEIPFWLFNHFWIESREKTNNLKLTYNFKSYHFLDDARKAIKNNDSFFGEKLDYFKMLIVFENRNFREEISEFITEKYLSLIKDEVVFTEETHFVKTLKEIVEKKLKYI